MPPRKDEEGVIHEQEVGHPNEAKPKFHRTGSMIPEPRIELDRPAECCGTFMTLTSCEKTHDNPPDPIMKHVRLFCESQAMVEFCEKAGLHGVSFEWNPANDGGSRYFRRHSNVTSQFWKAYETRVKKAIHLRPRHEQYIRFWDAYKHDVSLKNIGVVFHGSPEDRIPKILENGLDPRYRHTQAFGKGEYFPRILDWQPRTAEEDTS